MAFIGREEEMQRLEDICSADGVKTVVVYGRRRIGKSTLLKEFCRGRRSLYIQSPQGAAADILHAFALAVSAFSGEPRDDYRFIQDAFDDIAALCREERTVVVIDEFPFLIGEIPSAASIIQGFIDTSMEGTDTMFIICGSSIGVMEHETTDYDRPLHGRFGHRMKVGPLSYQQCSVFHPCMSEEDRMCLYLTVGGVPRYHGDTAAASYRDYITAHFLDGDADLRDEAETIISAELSPRERYIGIVNAICGGSTSHKQIHGRVGIDKAACTRCLKKLKELDIVDTVRPILGAPKQPVYRISDPIVAFSATVMPAADALALSAPSDVYDYMEQRIRTFLGQRFEDVCAVYASRRWRCVKMGRWWGTDGYGETHEIDIVATVLEGEARVILFGECKFTRRPVQMSVLKGLESDADATGSDMTRRYVLFSVSGFSSDLEETAEERSDLTLVDLGELVSRLR